MPGSGRARFRTHRIVFLLAALAYLPAFWWGAPHATAEDRRKAWGVDDEPPLGPLSQLKDMLTPGVAKDANLGYPMLHSYLLIGAMAPYMGYLSATGRFSSPSGTFPYGFADPVTALRDLSWIAHFLSVLLGAGIVLAAYVTARTLWDERDGRWAAAFTGLSYPMFYYARTSNVDVPALFFVAWSLAALATVLARGVTTRRVARLGALVGLAVATKEPMAATFVSIPLLLLFPYEQWRGIREPGALVGASAAGLGAALSTYALGSGMLLDFERWREHIIFAFLRTGEVARGSIAFLNGYPNTLAGNAALFRDLMSRVADALTWPTLLLAAAGLCLVLRNAGTRRTLWVALAGATYLITLFAMVRTVQLRYIMPASMVLALFAGHAAARLTYATAPFIRRTALAASGAAVLTSAWWALDLTNAMLRDSRYEAGQWLAREGRPGDRLEYFGAFQKNPPLDSTIVSHLAVEYLGGTRDAPRDEGTAERIRAGWRERRPRFIVLIPDHTSHPGEPFARSCPPQIFFDLEHGHLGYVRARLFHTPPLLPVLPRPRLDYGAVNPEVRIYVPSDDPALGATS